MLLRGGTKKRADSLFLKAIGSGRLLQPVSEQPKTQADCNRMFPQSKYYLEVQFSSGFTLSGQTLASCAVVQFF